MKSLLRFLMDFTVKEDIFKPYFLNILKYLKQLLVLFWVYMIKKKKERYVLIKMLPGKSVSLLIS